MTRRSTRTTMVLSIAWLATWPMRRTACRPPTSLVSVSLIVSRPRRGGRRAQLALAQHGLEPRDLAPQGGDAAGVGDALRAGLEAQIEELLLLLRHVEAQLGVLPLEQL